MSIHVFLRIFFSFSNAHVCDIKIKQCNRSIYVASLILYLYRLPIKEDQKEKNLSVASWKT